MSSCAVARSVLGCSVAWWGGPGWAAPVCWAGEALAGRSGSSLENTSKFASEDLRVGGMAEVSGEARKGGKNPETKAT